MPFANPAKVANKAREDRNANIVYAIAAGLLAFVVAILMMYNLLVEHSVGLAGFLLIFVIAFGSTAAHFCLKVSGRNAGTMRQLVSFRR
jgi:Flp pilus assembly protein TadB